MKLNRVINMSERLIDVLFCLLILSLSSCGKNNDEPNSNQLEGVWGLAHEDYYMSDSELPKNSEDYNPYDPSSSSDLKLVVVNTKDNIYLFSQYHWNKSKETWIYDKKFTAVLEDGKLIVESPSNNNIEIISFNSKQLEIKRGSYLDDSYSLCVIQTYRKLSNEITIDNNGGAQNNSGDSSNNSNSGNNSGNNTGTKQKTYYVKYSLELSYQGTETSKSFSIEYQTDNGVKQKTETIKTGKTFVWEETYGPFKLGDRTSLKCITYRPRDNVYSAEYKGNGKIYVKEDDGPFTVKAEGSINNVKWAHSAVISWNDLNIYYYIK